MTAFSTILADPPWPYRSPGVPGNGGRGKPANASRQTLLAYTPSSVNRYGSMTIPELCALRPPATTNAHLYLWTTNAFLVEAHEIARAWGFRPITLITWTKTGVAGGVSMRTGYYYRGATEHMLFAVRGSLRLCGPLRPTAFLSPRLPHSVKPECSYQLIEEQSPGPYLEMFARRTRPGWATWGNQVHCDIDLTDSI